MQVTNQLTSFQKKVEDVGARTRLVDRQQLVVDELM